MLWWVTTTIILNTQVTNTKVTNVHTSALRHMTDYSRVKIGKMKNLILVILSVICAGKLIKLCWKTFSKCSTHECPTHLRNFSRNRCKSAKRRREKFAKILIFSDKKILFIFLVNCSELIVLNTPKSIEFKGDSEVPAESLSSVLSATLGYSIDGLSSWDGLFVNDPFNAAKSVVSVVVEGVDSLNLQVITNLSGKKRNYSIFPVSWF